MPQNDTNIALKKGTCSLWYNIHTLIFQFLKHTQTQKKPVAAALMGYCVLINNRADIHGKVMYLTLNHTQFIECAEGSDQ